MWSFGYMAYLWLKFCVIWRLFRLWSLLDDIDVYDNQKRCVFISYSFEFFWRSWHRSFNRWLVRYVYVPLGGRKYKYLSLILVFIFVIIFHDGGAFELFFWIWGLGIMIGFIVEIFLRKYFNSKKVNFNYFQ